MVEEAIAYLAQGSRPAAEGLLIEAVAAAALIINMKTAKALGLTIPRSMLVRADRVIE